MTSLGLKESEDAFQAVFDRWDTDGAGTLDFRHLRGGLDPMAAHQNPFPRPPAYPIPCRLIPCSLIPCPRPLPSSRAQTSNAKP